MLLAVFAKLVLEARSEGDAEPVVPANNKTLSLQTKAVDSLTVSGYFFATAQTVMLIVGHE